MAFMFKFYRLGMHIVILSFLVALGPENKLKIASYTGMESEVSRYMLLTVVFPTLVALAL